MTQKDKVKELVGRGLHSYHTKALQQIDRIEKKNKEQNHKISILSNELDNDYLTKTEEGSVVSLEHSKEGMVYLDELQGNTLVNYCTDGAKELTLNGDIDVEGTFVTTTEGVDNGKVDVVCEGNTLVNLATIKSVTLSNAGSKVISNLTFKQDTKYTLIFDVDSNSVTNESHEGIYLWFTADGITSSTVSALDLKGRKKYVMTRSDKANGWGIGCRNDLSGTVILNNILILEGDWTDREVPSYFEGMKSVGQDDTNGHKIEILSQNKNLYNPATYKNVNVNNVIYSCENGILSANGTSNSTTDLDFDKTTPFYFEKEKVYSIKVDVLSDSLSYSSNTLLAIKVTNRDGSILWNTYKITDGIAKVTLYGNIVEKIERVRFYTTGTHTFTNFRARVQIEEGNVHTDYVAYALNKKEISLNEPLRAIGDIKDRFIKQGNKWYIERNCKQVPLIELARRSSSAGNTENYIRLCYSGNAYNIKERSKCLCDTIKALNEPLVTTEGKELVSTDTYLNYVYINVYTGNVPLEQRVNEGVKRVEQLNPNLIYQLETPTYEEITDVELITYLDTTHISNNSTIPCNMKIKNSGYNAIIKPSTLYTIALDTNKSGTIGMNLGGAKGTTTNNVLKLTTPATLTDDSLRLYGKGIKGSKVRLLEGDKTNWIPSHFEGMKSSFEDKFDATDNTYKMEILSNNRNLIKNGENYKNWDGYTPYQKLENGFILEYSVGRIAQNKSTLSNLKHGETYTFSCDVELLTPLKRTLQVYRFGDNMLEYGTSTTTSRKFVYTFKHDNSMPNIGIYFQGNEYENAKAKITNIQLEKGHINTECIDREYDKIQFSSIEPLRKLDRFVLKDGELMIERNNAKKILNGTENWMYDTTSSSQEVGRFGFNNIGMKGNRSLVICDKYAFKTNYTMTSHNYEGTFTSIGGSTLYLDTLLNKLETKDLDGFKKWLSENLVEVVYELAEPTYEEIPYELQKIILEGYENGTLFIDTNIPPTITTTYAGETPIAKSVKLNKTEVSNNTDDINDNIIPYLMDMDYRVVCLQLESNIEGISMSRLFGGAYEMLKRDILSKRLSKEEYGYRLIDYFNTGKLTEEEVRELEDLR